MLRRLSVDPFSFCTRYASASSASLAAKQAFAPKRKAKQRQPPRTPETDNCRNPVNLFTTRTHTCGQLTVDHLNTHVHLFGWLQHSRLRGRFFLLRDSYGKVQCVVDLKRPELARAIKTARIGAYLRVDAVVQRRPDKDVNRDMATGAIELAVDKLQVINNPPESSFVQDFEDLTEEQRLRFRHLELRRFKMQYNLRLRSKILQSMRNILANDYGFVDVETPLLFKDTPGGADEFIVPSGTDPPKCYTLPQSPQQFKQILMVAGVDRYFQVAKCFRNEHIHKDRQPEFTQLDIEMTCPSHRGIQSLVEQVICKSWEEVGHLPFLAPSAPFPTMKYCDAMNNYGTDKPDTRFGWLLERLDDHENSVMFHTDENVNFSDLAVDFSAFDHRLSQLNLPRLSYVLYAEDGSVVHRFGCDSPLPDPVYRGTHAIISADNRESALTAGGLLRILLADAIEENNQTVRYVKFAFLWVVDFPLFTRNEAGRLESSHHPFTAPVPEHVDLLKSDPTKVIGQHFDLVLNGTELGGGSIRIHDPELQKFVLDDVLKIDSTNLNHLLKVLSDGAPPHGGIALGIDRYLALLTKSKSIRDVIAFPKSKEGRDVMANAPAFVSHERLAKFGLRTLQ